MSTRILVLIPVSIALNIALGSIVGQVLRLPVYLDSIGTILIGVLAGPIPGLLTGVLTDLIWGYAIPPPIGSPTAGPFAITAGCIGLLAGLWGRLGIFRLRRQTTVGPVAAAVGAVALAAIVAGYTFSRAYSSSQTYAANTGFSPAAFTASRAIFVAIIAVFAALVIYGLFIRRDPGVALALAAGLVTGVAAALISAPIAAYVFGGVTGGGTDLLVALFRAGGASVYSAVLQQGLLSDPLDKLITCFVVYLIIAGMPRRLLLRYPNGERLAGPD